MARKQGSHSDITGPKIKEAALRLFAQHGYAAVSMRQIAAEVGVQAGALYNYTSDKQALLFELLQDHMNEVMQALENVDLTGDPVVALRRLTHFHIHFHEPRRDEIFLSYMELRNLTPENFKKIEEYRRGYETHLQAILNRGVQSGAFQILDTRITSLAVIALLNGINNWYRPDGRLSIEEVEAIYWDLVKKAVGAV